MHPSCEGFARAVQLRSCQGALAAYDVGPERVEQYIRFVSEDNGVPSDAREYVARIVKEFNNKKKIEAAGRERASGKSLAKECALWLAY